MSLCHLAVEIDFMLIFAPTEVVSDPLSIRHDALMRRVWIHESLEDEARRVWETYAPPREPTAIERGLQRRYMSHYRRRLLYPFVH